MRKITDEGFLFLYGAGLLVTAETGMPAVITILFACIYTCVNLVGEEKYLHYIMTIAFVAAGVVSLKRLLNNRMLVQRFQNNCLIHLPANPIAQLKKPRRSPLRLRFFS